MFVRAYLLTTFNRCIDEKKFIVFKRVDGFHHVTSFPYVQTLSHPKIHDNNFTLCTFHIESQANRIGKFFLLYVSEGNHLHFKC